MPVRTNIQIDEKDYAFIKNTYKELCYRSISEYLRDAITAKIEQDRKILREKSALRRWKLWLHCHMRMPLRV